MSSIPPTSTYNIITKGIELLEEKVNKFNDSNIKTINNIIISAAIENVLEES